MHCVWFVETFGEVAEKCDDIETEKDDVEIEGDGFEDAEGKGAGVKDAVEKNVVIVSDV